ncbi:hypothetical protein QBC32DRAFT_336402 [Pseudoneurospora amorphoporcata]|uniref:Uncharacterized protein n=1 Tax=Pseudoneurospora amorphoporcata TaxID=241081 RepID=A0AAN6P0L2_9PEZI|nr:hypothetical protein QBC32DRAFT_336402 [Pseudoneurospora amorphoporcata]
MVYFLFFWFIFLVYPGWFGMYAWKCMRGRLGVLGAQTIRRCLWLFFFAVRQRSQIKGSFMMVVERSQHCFTSTQIKELLRFLFGEDVSTARTVTYTQITGLLSRLFQHRLSPNH